MTVYLSHCDCIVQMGAAVVMEGMGTQWISLEDRGSLCCKISIWMVHMCAYTSLKLVTHKIMYIHSFSTCRHVFSSSTEMYCGPSSKTGI